MPTSWHSSPTGVDAHPTGGVGQVVLTSMFDGKFRAPIDRAVKPIGNALRKTGLSPDHLTIIGLLVAVGAAVAIGFGQLRLGLVLVILAALPDLFDGALAKASDSSSQRGAYFDSVVDRVTDATLFVDRDIIISRPNDEARTAVRDLSRCNRASNAFIRFGGGEQLFLGDFDRSRRRSAAAEHAAAESRRE